MIDYKKLKNLDIEKKKDLAVDIRQQIFDACKRNSGHLSSNLGVVELTISLLSNFDPLVDDIIFDVGHQSYAYKLLTGRSLNRLRHIDGVAPFSLREESIYDKTSSGHSGDSISLALGISKGKSDDSYTIALIGDSSFKNGLAQEAYIYLKEHATDFKRLIIVINSNGMAIKMNSDSQAIEIREKQQEFKDDLKRKIDIQKEDDIYHINDINGHDFTSLDDAFKKAKDLSIDSPVIMNVITKKGKGYLKAEEDEIGLYHGVNIDFDSKTDKKIDDYKIELIDDMMKKDNDLFVITPAMEYSSNLTEIFERYKDRCIDVSIAEENAIALASGLSLKGKKVIVDIYSTFLQRTIDQIIEDVLRQNLNILFLIERASLCYQDGSSHHGIYDIPMLSSLNNIKMYMPYDKTSLSKVLSLDIFKSKSSNFIRIEKDSGYKTTEIFADDISFLDQHKDSKSVIISDGVDGLSFLENCHMNLDKALLYDLIDYDVRKIYSYDNIFFVDRNSNSNGNLSIMKNKLFDVGYRGNLYPFTLPSGFISHGTKDELYKHLRLDDQYIIEKIKEILSKEC